MLYLVCPLCCWFDALGVPRVQVAACAWGFLYFWMVMTRKPFFIQPIATVGLLVILLVVMFLYAIVILFSSLIFVCLSGRFAFVVFIIAFCTTSVNMVFCTTFSEAFCATRILCNIQARAIILSEVSRMAFKDKQAEREYQQQFHREKYDRIALVVPKGKKEEYKAIAESKGESLNGYINRLLEEDANK